VRLVSLNPPKKAKITLRVPRRNPKLFSERAAFKVERPAAASLPPQTCRPCLEHLSSVPPKTGRPYLRKLAVRTSQTLASMPLQTCRQHLRKLAVHASANLSSAPPQTCHFDRSRPTPFLPPSLPRRCRSAQWRNLSSLSCQSNGMPKGFAVELSIRVFIYQCIILKILIHSEGAPPSICRVGLAFSGVLLFPASCFFQRLAFPAPCFFQSQPIPNPNSPTLHSSVPVAAPRNQPPP